MRGWLEKNVNNTIFLEIRDTRENDVSAAVTETSLAHMLMDPLFVIQNKWEAFQSYNHSFLKDYSPHFLEGPLHYVTLSYVPEETKSAAELNFHLTQSEKEDIYKSINNADNQRAVDTLLKLLH